MTPRDYAHNETSFTLPGRCPASFPYETFPGGEACAFEQRVPQDTLHTTQHTQRLQTQSKIRWPAVKPLKTFCAASQRHGKRAQNQDNCMHAGTCMHVMQEEDENPHERERPADNTVQRMLAIQQLRHACVTCMYAVHACTHTFMRVPCSMLASIKTCAPALKSVIEEVVVEVPPLTVKLLMGI